MNDMNCKKIIEVLKSDFGSLWHCFNRGESLEFVTPFLYPDKKFVSIFITTRGKRIIVSDGGQLSEFIKAATDDEAFQTAILGKFKDSYGVEKFPQKQRGEFYFKECADPKLISSVVFDLGNFISSASSAAVLAVTEEEALERKSFRTKAGSGRKNKC